MYFYDIYLKVNCGTYALTATTEWQEFSSPNYPGDYNNNAWCNKLITPDLTYVVMEPLQFRTERGYDLFYVYENSIFDGSHTAYDGTMFSEPIIHDGAIATIFDSDSTSSYSGFLIRYKSGK